MSDTAQRLSTYDDLLGLSEDVRAEIIGGTIITAPTPLPRHSHTQGALRSFIGGPFDDDDGRDGPGRWWVFLEVDVRLGPHDIVRPDLAGWRRPRLTRPGLIRPIDIVPDWVCEVISPSTEPRDRVEKSALYARTGVPFMWLVDPAARMLEALALRDDRWHLDGAYSDQAMARIAPFEAVELEVGRLFLPRDAD